MTEWFIYFFFYIFIRELLHYQTWYLHPYGCGRLLCGSVTRRRIEHRKFHQIANDRSI